MSLPRNHAGISGRIRERNAKADAVRKHYQALGYSVVVVELDGRVRARRETDGPLDYKGNVDHLFTSLGLDRTGGPL